MKTPTEHEEQATLIEWTEVQGIRYPELRKIFAIPNGGHRNVITARKLKAEGVKPGVPDLFLPVPRNGVRGLFIEIKRRKGGRLSPEQHDWRDFLLSQGYGVEICKGWEEARDVLIDYLRLKNEH